ncbi:MAG: type IV pilus assembly protein PilM [Armatimonadota bacterium]
MARGESYLGIDVGSGAIKLVELAPGAKGLRLVRAVTVPLDGGTTGLSDERVRTALRSALASQRVQPTAVAGAIPTRVAAVREMKLPHTSDENVGRMVRFEAERFIPFPAEEVTLDHHVLDTQTQEAAQVLVVATRKQEAMALVELLGGLNLPEAAIEVTAIASFNALSRNGGPETPSAIVDIGHRSTDIVLRRGQQLVLARSAPVGSHELTEAYHKDLQVDFVEAEQAKRERGVVGVSLEGGGSVSSGELTGAPATGEQDRPEVAEWLGRLVHELRHTMESFRRQAGEEVERIELAGGGALTPGLPEALATALAAEVTVSRPWGRIEVARASPDAPDPVFAVASGLAVQAAGRAALDINLTPEEVRASRRTRAQTGRYATVAAVVCALLALLIGGLLASTALRVRKLERLRTELRQAGGGAGELDASQTEATVYAEVVKALDAMRAEGATPLEVLLLLSHPEHGLAEGVWITEFSYRAGEAVVIRGSARDSPSVTDSIRALQGAEVFADVTLDYRNLTDIAGTPVYDFRITCKLPQQAEE